MLNLNRGRLSPHSQRLGRPLPLAVEPAMKLVPEGSVGDREEEGGRGCRERPASTNEAQGAVTQTPAKRLRAGLLSPSPTSCHPSCLLNLICHRQDSVQAWFLLSAASFLKLWAAVVVPGPWHSRVSVWNALPRSQHGPFPPIRTQVTPPETKAFPTLPQSRVRLSEP